MNSFFVGSPVLPIIISPKRPSEPTRRVSDLSAHTLTEATLEKPSIEVRATTSSTASKSSSSSRHRLHRLRHFFSFKKQNLDYEKIENPKPKRIAKKYEETSWDQYYAGMQYGCIELYQGKSDPLAGLYVNAEKHFSYPTFLNTMLTSLLRINNHCLLTLTSLSMYL